MIKVILKNKFFIISIVLLVIISIYLYNSIPNEVKLIIGNEKYIFTKESTPEVINLTTLNSEFDTIIKKEELFSNVKINGKKLNSKKNLGILEIDQKNKIILEIKYKGDRKYTKYIINTFPTTMPIFNCIGESKTKGDFYFTTYGANFGETNMGKDIYLLKLNNKGKIIFYRKGGYKSFQFKKEIINNKIYYSYLDEDKLTGKECLSILDEKYNLIKTIKFNKRKNNSNVDSHDYLLLDLNSYIINIVESDNTELIQEIKDDKVVWQHEFHPREFEDIDKNGNKVLVEAQHHFNSFELDSDNNLLVSFRHSNEIVKIDRKTGNIIWRLGDKHNNDFDKEIFSRQHSIVRVDNTYMVFSNNNKSITNDIITMEEKSSITIFNLDQQQKKVKNIKNYYLDCHSYQLGSVWPSDINNDIYVVDYGRSTDKGEKCIQEINIETKEVYFTFEYPDEEATVYRTYKY